MCIFAGLEFTITFLVYNRFNWDRSLQMSISLSYFISSFVRYSMQQGKMFFMMGLCMACVQGGYVRRIPHGKEITAAMSVSLVNKRLITDSLFRVGFECFLSKVTFLINVR